MKRDNANSKIGLLRPFFANNSLTSLRSVTYPYHNVTLEGITAILVYYILSCHGKETFQISTWLPS